MQYSAASHEQLVIELAITSKVRSPPAPYAGLYMCQDSDVPSPLDARVYSQQLNRPHKTTNVL